MTNVTRLPGPVADLWDWQRMGLCRGRDSAQFFHPDGERGASRGRRETAAKAVCRACPVRAECAAQALATREPYGVWGGFSEAERLRLLTTGWEDCADRHRARVDVTRLETRLGLRPAPAQRPVPAAAQRGPTPPATPRAIGTTAPSPTHPSPPAQPRRGAVGSSTRTRAAR